MAVLRTTVGDPLIAGERRVTFTAAVGVGVTRRWLRRIAALHAEIGRVEAGRTRRGLARGAAWRGQRYRRLSHLTRVPPRKQLRSVAGQDTIEHATLAGCAIGRGKAGAVDAGQHRVARRRARRWGLAARLTDHAQLAAALPVHAGRA